MFTETQDVKALAHKNPFPAGTFLHIAHEEGLIHNSSIHARIRAPLRRRKEDIRNDLRRGFETIEARDIDQLAWTVW